MTMWFGESWGAPANEEPHMDTPVGQPCLHCEEWIVEGDRGFILPCFRSLDKPPTFEPIHFECQMRDTLGSVGHLLKKCPCFGGNETDPPHMTKRQAAIAAWDLFMKQTGIGEA